MQSALAGPAAPKLGMASSDKTRKLKRQCNDQDDGPGTKRLSFTRLFVFPILCGHDTLLCPGVDYLVTVAGRPALVCGEDHTWQRNPGQCLTISGHHVIEANRFCCSKAEERPGDVIPQLRGQPQ